MPVYVNSRRPNSGVTAAEQKRNDEWNKMMAQARMAMQMDERTAIGFALGKLLKDGWESWKRHQAEREDEKNRRKAEANDTIANASGATPTQQQSLREANPGVTWAVGQELVVPDDWNKPTQAPTEPQYLNHTGAYDIGYTPEQKDYDLSRWREGASPLGYQPIDLQEVLTGRRKYF